MSKRGAAGTLAVLVVVAVACVPFGLRGEALSGAGSDAASTAVFGSRLAFGVRNDPADLNWMVESRVPWAARYTYLAGGVNTGEGWATWTTEPGFYATDYAKRSIAEGYVPIFSYYQLQQSRPRIGATERERAYSNLNDRTTMRDYYSDFRRLLRSLADVGTTVVHVEPDLWGYIQQTRSEPSAVMVSVRTSGDPDVTDVPDNAVGFAQALLGMRDRYAPNVLLAVHVSAWGAGADPVVSTAALDATRLARDTANFVLDLERGGRRWDLVFHDVIDRDAALAAGKVTGRSWWDATDKTVPNFSRWLMFVRALTSSLERPVVLWQVPVGNQRYRSLDNSPGHFQDNRAEYFLAHADVLAASGVAAVLFGPGVDEGTWYLDARHDGVTNPPPISTFGCDRCNTEIATFADDDGGHLRLAVGAYYRAGGVALQPR